MKDPIVEVAIRRAHRLTSTGEGLLQRLNMNRVEDYGIAEDISNWISLAIDELLAIMPEEWEDYAELAKIRSQYTRDQSILQSSSEDHIRKILKNLHSVRECAMASAEADAKDIPRQNLALMSHEQLRQSVDYVKAELIPRLMGKENGRTRKTAVLHVYGRIYMWAQSMVKLDAIADSLALAGCVRAILELYVDLNLMVSSAIPEDVEKYFSFQRVEQWGKARSTAKSWVEFGLAEDGNATPADEYLKRPENEESKIEALRKRLWGLDRKGKPINPQHWTDKSLIDRIKILPDNRGVAGMYCSSYYYCNCLVHSMYSDITRDADDVHLFNWHLYELASRMLLGGAKLTNDMVGALPQENLESRVREIESRLIKFFFGELVKAGRNKRAD
jgi:hypothetical protein